MMFDSNLYYENGIYRTPTMLDLVSHSHLKMKEKGLLIYEKKEELLDEAPLSGERGIRTPGPFTVNGFQDRRIRPLCHLSACKIIVCYPIFKKFVCLITIFFNLRGFSKRNVLISHHDIHTDFSNGFGIKLRCTLYQCTEFLRTGKQQPSD